MYLKLGRINSFMHVILHDCKILCQPQFFLNLLQKHISFEIFCHTGLVRNWTPVWWSKNGRKGQKMAGSSVGHIKWWGNGRNGFLGPENDPKMQIWSFLGYLGSIATISSEGWPEFNASFLRGVVRVPMSISWGQLSTFEGQILIFWGLWKVTFQCKERRWENPQMYPPKLC